MAWCRQATNHYLGQCWPSPVMPFGATRLQLMEEAWRDSQGVGWGWVWVWVCGGGVAFGGWGGGCLGGCKAATLLNAFYQFSSDGGEYTDMHNIKKERPHQLYLCKLIVTLQYLFDKLQNWSRIRKQGTKPTEQWCGPLIFPLMLAWTNSWTKRRMAGDLRRHRGHVTSSWR